MVTNNITKNFRPFIEGKTESDYCILVNNKKYNTNLMIYTNKDDTKIINGVQVVTQSFIERMSPDNIDINNFWVMATSNFPLFSVAGGVQDFTTIEEVNKSTLDMARNLSTLENFYHYLIKDFDMVILEIGPGYGGFKNFVSTLPSTDKNYYAIDVNPLFQHERLFKCNGRNIPSEIPHNLGIVYSINVFQHLSKSQRTSYYHDIYDRLIDGGCFIFGMFVITEFNKDWSVWGTKDEQGNYYTNFFNQLTKVDTEYELLNELKEIGFSVEQILLFPDKTHYITYKCIKNDREISEYILKGK